jgi:hypothetical protein
MLLSETSLEFDVLRGRPSSRQEGRLAVARHRDFCRFRIPLLQSSSMLRDLARKSPPDSTEEPGSARSRLPARSILPHFSPSTNKSGRVSDSVITCSANACGQAPRQAWPRRQSYTHSLQPPWLPRLNDACNFASLFSTLRESCNQFWRQYDPSTESCEALGARSPLARGGSARQ